MHFSETEISKMFFLGVRLDFLISLSFLKYQEKSEIKNNFIEITPIVGQKEIIEDFLEGKLSLNANYCNHDDQHEHNCQN